MWKSWYISRIELWFSWVLFLLLLALCEISFITWDPPNPSKTPYTLIPNSSTLNRKDLSSSGCISALRPSRLKISFVEAPMPLARHKGRSLELSCNINYWISINLLNYYKYIKTRLIIDSNEINLLTLSMMSSFAMLMLDFPWYRQIVWLELWINLSSFE